MVQKHRKRCSKNVQDVCADVPTESEQHRACNLAKHRDKWLATAGEEERQPADLQAK